MVPLCTAHTEALLTGVSPTSPRTTTQSLHLTRRGTVSTSVVSTPHRPQLLHIIRMFLHHVCFVSLTQSIHRSRLKLVGQSTDFLFTVLLVPTESTSNVAQNPPPIRPIAPMHAEGFSMLPIYTQSVWADGFNYLSITVPSSWDLIGILHDEQWCHRRLLYERHVARNSGRKCSELQLQFRFFFLSVHTHLLAWVL